MSTYIAEECSGTNTIYHKVQFLRPLSKELSLPSLLTTHALATHSELGHRPPLINSAGSYGRAKLRKMRPPTLRRPDVQPPTTAQTPTTATVLHCPLITDIRLALTHHHAWPNHYSRCHEQILKDPCAQQQPQHLRRSPNSAAARTQQNSRCSSSNNRAAAPKSPTLAVFHRV